MRIGNRIAAGFTVVVVLAAIIGGVGWFSLHSVGTAAAAARQAQSLATLIDGIRADVLRYRHEPEDGLAAEVTARLDGVAPLLAQVIAASRWDGSDAEGARAAVDEFGAAFAALVEASRRNAASLESMERRSDEITRFTEDFPDSAPEDAREQVFSMRLAQASMHSIEQGLRGGRIETATAEMMAALRPLFTATIKLKQMTSGPLAEQVAKVADTVHQYRTEFESVREVADHRRTADERIAQAVNRLEELLRGDAERVKSSMERVQRTSTWLLLAGVLLGLSAGTGIAIVLTKGIVRPVRTLTHLMEDLATGNLAVQVAGTDRVDEIGAMARAVKVFKQNAEEVRSLQADKAAQEIRARQEQREVRLRLAETMRETLGSLVHGVTEASSRLEHSAQSLSASSVQTSRQAQWVAEAAHQALTSLEKVLSSAEELSRSATEIGGSTAESSEIAREAVAGMTRTDQTLGELSQSAESITAVISLIQTIAAQTNLLALNATIEAARAGEAGKGFAVVAGEVKALATQTSSATVEISRQIEAIQTETGDTIAAIRGAGKIISRMDHISALVTATAETQTSATRDIVDTLSRAATDTRDVSLNIKGVTQVAESTGIEAAHVLDAARSLAHDAQMLRREVEAFIAGVCRE
ncbi:HAMP domain-containing methyl-accepting chemotaxis protein [Magnetospirillum sp. 15-1]|uniref:methyl-accepting chemotaxis protein n=1 Tax=Magnetospirillum sp. 15-1 TaxID=1979370 RepID=UPI000BBC3B37|nr:HAMP domain-containing methyl-accepting chemotaxis protein [Magnetospirillum sp. 15-1]